MKQDNITDDHTMFRILLRAMSRPGIVCQLSSHRQESGQRALLAVMLRCLMDHETTYFVMENESDGLSDEIFRHTGGNLADIDTADFLIFPEGTSRGTLTGAKRGTPEYPDIGATAVYLVEKLGELGGEMEMHGPGIDGTIRPLISGLAKAEISLLREANSEFPLGVDALFLDTEGRIMCIPRSTRIEGN